MSLEKIKESIKQKPFYEEPNGLLYHFDCLKLLKEMRDESVDLIVTDPPYGYSFMGKDWDKAVPPIEVWVECVRILKPGAFAFVMSAPRQDVLSQMIVRLSEAGFRTDFSSIYWTYASGFPKAMNIGKAVDKRFKGQRKIVGQRDFERTPFKSDGTKGGNSFHGQKHDNRPQGYLTEPATPQAKGLDGSYAGFQPKPAVEVVIVAMKPLSEKTFVDQALKNGKGITWLDDGRIGNEKLSYTSTFKRMIDNNIDQGYRPQTMRGSGGSVDRIVQGRFPANLLVSDDVLNDGRVTVSKQAPRGGTNPNPMHRGGSRPDGNISKGHTDSGSFSRYFDLDKWWEEMVKKLPRSVQKTFPFLIVPKASKSEKNRGCEKFPRKTIGHNRYDRCSRCGKYIFQNPNRPSTCKCEKPIREYNSIKGNYHPTCKPIKLKSYLITIGSRPGDIVLDPYIGSGTTGIAAEILGRTWIGIDDNKEYLTIAQARIKGESSGAQLPLLRR